MSQRVSPSAAGPGGRRRAVASHASAAADDASRLRRPAQRAPARQVRVAAEAPRVPEEVKLEQQVASHMPPGKDLELKLTDNRYTMITVRRQADGYGVRVHRMFAASDSRTVRHLARYIVHNDPRASAALGDFIRDNDDIIKDQPRQRRPLRVRTQGKIHNLQSIFDTLNRNHFAGAIKARITWGSAPKRLGRRRSIKMGSYSVEDRVIRIHPALDRADVPEYFVAWIVFHEMLHDKHGAVEKDGRRCYHTKAFMDEERSFVDYERAAAWEKAHIQSLLVG
ncbi:MAG: hypothetical protein SF187_23265 [Deltaproteobacteria bacterium]|nr:hypothetical protein [Deltaproteobacteria bacterium]